jgi:hypothetical protein
MDFWFGFWLFVHIFSAIAAYGPTLAFPVIASVSGQAGQPLVASKITEAIEKKYTSPLGGITFLSGIVLIFVVPGLELLEEPWLIAAIVLWVAAAVFAGAVQGRNARALKELLEKAPAGAPAADAPAGPPPEVATLVKKVQQGGMLLTLDLVAVVALMVWKPGG